MQLTGPDIAGLIWKKATTPAAHTPKNTKTYIT